MPLPHIGIGQHREGGFGVLGTRRPELQVPRSKRDVLERLHRPASLSS